MQSLSGVSTVMNGLARGRHCTGSALTFYLLTQVRKYSQQHQHSSDDTNQYSKSDNEQNSYHT